MLFYCLSINDFLRYEIKVIEKSSVFQTKSKYLSTRWNKVS